jgi:hypothetical protein
MKRRHFIGASAASLLLPAVPKLCFGELPGFAQEQEYLFFDERFPKARLTTISWSASNRLIGIQGDITPVWGNGLNRMTRHHPLRLRGLTTQAFLFCLRILACEHADLDVQAQRIDRDLWQWTILTTPKLTAETRHG